MQELPKQGTVVEHPEPYLLRLSGQWDPTTELKLEKVDNPVAQGTLGDIGLATSVAGPAQFPQTLLIQPFDKRGLTGIIPTSIRLFAGIARPVRCDRSGTQASIWGTATCGQRSVDPDSTFPSGSPATGCSMRRSGIWPTNDGIQTRTHLMK